jgi:hypothetical protein
MRRRQSFDSKRITNMLSMAESDLYVKADQLDRDVWALNFLKPELSTWGPAVSGRSTRLTSSPSA